MNERRLSIWFIIGLQLVIMGIIVLGASALGFISPPSNPVVFENLHPGLYEGAALLFLGLFYTFQFRPR